MGISLQFEGGAPADENRAAAKDGLKRYDGLLPT